LSCPENNILLHAYLDGELDLLSTLRLEAHLRECEACARAHESHQTLRSAMSSAPLHFKPPDDLARRIHLALEEADRAARPGPPPVLESPGRISWQRLWRRAARPFWAAAGVAAAAAIVLVVLRFGPAPSSPSREDLLAQEVLASHVRSLMANHLTDVPSSDQHTVKPWFDGKLDFSPPVQDLSMKGFLLVGGRLDYLEDRPVAALVYQRRKHFINLFVWPSPKDSKLKMVMRQGYNLLQWSRSGMTYWAVSDLNSTELQEFVQLIRGQDGHDR
jgi:anti-sigma factor RsiW